jgi:malonyl-CoA O-methyltransferase
VTSSWFRISNIVKSREQLFVADLNKPTRIARPETKFSGRADCVESLRSLLKRSLAAVGLRRFGNERRAVLSKVDAREAYRLWAPTYAETATSFLDEELAQEMLRGLLQARLLDAGCGIGRRIADLPGAVGIDASPEMLAAGGASNLVMGDVRAMPFASDSFDMVWCRLVLGYLPDPLRAYQEFARVCMPGGHVFVTDFHPDAVAAGHQRTFTDREGTVHEIEHYVHGNHAHLAEAAGLSLVACRDGVVGPSIRDFYVHGIGLKAFKRDAGLKLVAAFLFRRLE